MTAENVSALRRGRPASSCRLLRAAFRDDTGAARPRATGFPLPHRGTRRLRLYVTGDTLFGPHLEEIPRRFGEIDAMLIHLGGTRLLGNR
jgi:hypothetical protein